MSHSPDHKPRSNPRRFDKEAREICWKQSAKIDGRNPERWRLDAVGNPILKALNMCYGPLCYQYDHIRPYSKGGESVGDNCQLLQSFVNIFKSNKEDLTKEDLIRVSPKIKFTPEQMDIIERAIYG